MPEFPELMQNLPEHADRRTHSRHRIRALAYVELGENNGGIVLNISEGGFGVRAAEAIQEESLPRLRFQMQYATQPLEMSGKIAWTSASRKEAALALRHYACPADVVIEVADELCPHNAGRWRLTAGDAASRRGSVPHATGPPLQPTWYCRCGR